MLQMKRPRSLAVCRAWAAAAVSGCRPPGAVGVGRWWSGGRTPVWREARSGVANDCARNPKRVRSKLRATAFVFCRKAFVRRRQGLRWSFARPSRSLKQDGQPHGWCGGWLLMAWPWASGQAFMMTPSFFVPSILMTSGAGRCTWRMCAVSCAAGRESR